MGKILINDLKTSKSSRDERNVFCWEFSIYLLITKVNLKFGRKM